MYKKYRKELFKLLLIEFYSLRNNRVAKTFRQGYLLLLTVKDLVEMRTRGILNYINNRKNYFRPF